MADTEEGKFCSHCAKQVIDYTTLSDSDILRVMKNHTGRLCGRFTTDQLNRQLSFSYPQKEYHSFPALLAGLLFFSTAEAPAGNPPTAAAVISTQTTEHTTTQEQHIIKEPADSLKTTIAGSVKEERTGHPVAHARVAIEGSKKHTKTDSKGHFKLSFSSSEFSNGHLILEVTKKDYKPLKMFIEQQKSPISTDLVLEKIIYIYGEFRTLD